MTGLSFGMFAAEDFEASEEDLKPAIPVVAVKAKRRAKAISAAPQEEFPDWDKIDAQHSEDDEGEAIQWESGQISPLMWRLDLDDCDFESPGIVPNPDFLPKGVVPMHRSCGGCGHTFLSVPFQPVKKTLFTPLFCSECDRFPAVTNKKPRLQMPYPWAFGMQQIQQVEKNIWRTPTGSILLTPFGTFDANSLASDPLMSSALSPVEPADLTITAGPSGHATHGPSSLKHKEICPYWKNTGGTNAMAERGTVMHEALQFGPSSSAYQTLTEDEKECVDMVAHLFNDTAESLGAGYTRVEETKCDVAGITWGTADTIAFSADRSRCIVMDAKFGFIEVDDAEENLQGWCYALAQFYANSAVSEVTVLFAQPRCDMVSSHKFTREADYDRMFDRIYTAVRNAHIAHGTKPDLGCETVVISGTEEKPAYNAVPSNCKWCANKLGCPAIGGVAIQVASQLDDRFHVPAHLDPANISDPATMGYLRQLADFLEVWVESVKKRSTQLASEECVDIPGYKLCTQDLPRVITNKHAAFEIFQQLGGTPEEFFEAVGSVGVTKLEDAVAANAPRGKKQQAKQELEDALLEAEAMERAAGQKIFLRRVKSPALN